MENANMPQFEGNGQQGELVKVGFHGDVIDAFWWDGKVKIAVRRVCESLGIDPATQNLKLRDAPWANAGLCPVLDATGKLRKTFCIDLDALPMWLATIDVWRVAPSVKEKLVQYQCEAAEVLRRYFLGEGFRPWAARFRESLAPHSRYVLTTFGPDSFTVITEAVMPMLMLEDECVRHMMEVRPGDRPCISIGLTFSHYYREQRDRLVVVQFESPPAR
jgi:hypothetical protein